jgi:BTB/POZ domain-containing protein KCTD9
MASKNGQVTVFANGNAAVDQAVTLIIPSRLDELLQQASDQLHIRGSAFFSAEGELIEDVAVLHDGDVLFLSCGEPFVENQLTATACDHTSLSSTAASGDWIRLNVGGRMFLTTRATLTEREPDSMLSRMFAASDGGTSVWLSAVDQCGAYLIDRSPTYFEPILNYLRSGELVLDRGVNPRGVLIEARFYGIVSLIDALEAKILEEEPATDNSPMTRTCLIKKLIGTTPEWELRCQGVNFEGTNLSKLDLRHINFKYAVLRNANLSHANLSYCNFERADLSSAKLDGANLLGVKMLCANLERASMHGCNFEDPAGTRANMEGANMKQVDLEGSHMAGVNLRVATLKNANLQNCDLRGAVLAGADLENCNLSGCDLQEANLRGANLKGAAFELMLNPLHMSQAVR